MKAVVSDEIHAPLQVELVTRIDKDDEGCSKSVSKKSIFVLRQAQHERKSFNELNP